jgi:hypothetical protein
MIVGVYIRALLSRPHLINLNKELWYRVLPVGKKNIVIAAY